MSRSSFITVIHFDPATNGTSERCILDSLLQASVVAVVVVALSLVLVCCRCRCCLVVGFGLLPLSLLPCRWFWFVAVVVVALSLVLVCCTFGDDPMQLTRRKNPTTNFVFRLSVLRPVNQ